MTASAGQSSGQHANSSLMFNALIWLLLLLAITVRPMAAITAAPPTQLQLQLQRAKSNYHDVGAEPFPGLAGYTRNYYGVARTLDDGGGGGGGRGGDLATYVNYAAKTSLGNGFVPTTTLTASNNNNYNYVQQPQLHYSSPHSHYKRPLDQDEYGAAKQGKIDFVINTANYESDAGEPAYEYAAEAAEGEAAGEEQSGSYYDQRHQHALRAYNVEQFSNYRPATTSAAAGRAPAIQQRQVSAENAAIYARINQRPVAPHPGRHPEAPHSGEDQQLLYSHAQPHIAQLNEFTPSYIHHNNNHNSINYALPPITNSVHHSPASNKAIAGLPLAKHVEITRHVPVAHYQRQHVPYRQTVQLQIPRTVIAAIPRPLPIKVPVTRTVAVPQLQELKIPIEKVKPVPVERPVPFVVERRVPYRVEKQVATPIYYPYPIKVPVVRTVVHKQLPAHAHSHQHSSLPPHAPHYAWAGLPAAGGWQHNSLLG